MPDLLRCQNGTYLAFDFGVKRIGVAVGEWPMALAHPLKTIRSERNDERFSAIAALIDEWKPIGLIVGLPLALDGTPHAMTGVAMTLDSMPASTGNKRRFINQFYRFAQLDLRPKVMLSAHTKQHPRHRGRGRTTWKGEVIRSCGRRKRRTPSGRCSRCPGQHRRA